MRSKISEKKMSQILNKRSLQTAVIFLSGVDGEGVIGVSGGVVTDLLPVGVLGGEVAVADRGGVCGAPLSTNV